MQTRNKKKIAADKFSPRNQQKKKYNNNTKNINPYFNTRGYKNRLICLFYVPVCEVGWEMVEREDCCSCMLMLHTYFFSLVIYYS